MFVTDDNTVSIAAVFCYFIYTNHQAKLSPDSTLVANGGATSGYTDYGYIDNVYWGIWH